MNSFVIKDWAGNRLCRDVEFPDFESGWDYILGELTDRLSLKEEDYQEFFVMPKERGDL